MAEYQLTATDIVFKYEGGWYIPNDPANTMRIEYDKWLAAGGVPDPAPPVVPPPPPPPDANLRIDAGVVASLATAVSAAQGIHLVTPSFTPANFSALLVQLKVLSDAFVSMLQAHAQTSTIDPNIPTSRPQ